MAIYDPNSNQHSNGSDSEVSVSPKLYRVKWLNEIFVSDPLNAAKQAREDIINGDSLIFDVEEIKDYGEPAIQKFTVDLGEDDEDAVLETN